MPFFDKEDEFYFLDACENCGFELDTAHDFLCGDCQEEVNERASRKNPRKNNKSRKKLPDTSTYQTTSRNSRENNVELTGEEWVKGVVAIGLIIFEIKTSFFRNIISFVRFNLWLIFLIGIPIILVLNMFRLFIYDGRNKKPIFYLTLMCCAIVIFVGFNRNLEQQRIRYDQTLATISSDNFMSLRYMVNFINSNHSRDDFLNRNLHFTHENSTSIYVDGASSISFRFNGQELNYVTINHAIEFDGIDVSRPNDHDMTLRNARIIQHFENRYNIDVSNRCPGLIEFVYDGVLIIISNPIMGSNRFNNTRIRFYFSDEQTRISDLYHRDIFVIPTVESVNTRDFDNFRPSLMRLYNGSTGGNSWGGPQRYSEGKIIDWVSDNNRNFFVLETRLGILYLEILQPLMNTTIYEVKEQLPIDLYGTVYFRSLGFNHESNRGEGVALAFVPFDEAEIPTSNHDHLIGIWWADASNTGSGVGIFGAPTMLNFVDGRHVYVTNNIFENERFNLSHISSGEFIARNDSCRGHATDHTYELNGDRLKVTDGVGRSWTFWR